MPDLTAQVNELKQAPDQALQQELQHPTGAVAPFLVMSEAQRRQLTRQAAQAQQNQGNSGSVYDDIVRNMMARQPPQNLPAAPAGMVPMGNATSVMPGATPPQNFQAPPRMMADGGLYDDEADDDEFSAADPFLEAGSDPFLQSPENQAQGIAALGAPQNIDEEGDDEFSAADPFGAAMDDASSDDLKQATLENLKGGHGGRKGRHGGRRGGRRGRHAGAAAGAAGPAGSTGIAGATGATDATSGGGGGGGHRGGGHGGGKGGGHQFKISDILKAIGSMGGGAAPHGGAAIHPPHFSYLHPMQQHRPAGFHFQSGGFTGDPLLEEPDAPAPDDYSDLISDAERRHGLPPRLMHAVMMQESGGDPNVEGKPIPSGRYKGQTAKGLFQFMDDTGKQYGVQNPFDPVQSIEGAGHYLGDLFKRYGGDIQKTLGGYYGWGVHHIGPSVQDYAQQVMGKMRELTGTQNHPTAAQTAQGKTADQPVTAPLAGAPTSADTGTVQPEQEEPEPEPTVVKAPPAAAPATPDYLAELLGRINTAKATVAQLQGSVPAPLARPNPADVMARASHAEQRARADSALQALQSRLFNANLSSSPQDYLRQNLPPQQGAVSPGPAGGQPSIPVPLSPDMGAVASAPPAPPPAAPAIAPAAPPATTPAAPPAPGPAPSGRHRRSRKHPDAPVVPAPTPQTQPVPQMTTQGQPQTATTLDQIPQNVRDATTALKPGERNDALLGYLSPEDQNLVKGITNYETNLGGRYAAVPQKDRPRLFALAKQYDPNFDPTNYDVKVKDKGAYAPGGKEGTNILAINTLGQHLNDLQKLWGDLHNPLHTGPLSGLNAPYNYLRKNLWHTPAFAAFENQRQIVAPEIEKVLTGPAGGSMQERREWQHGFSENATPEEQNIAMHTLLEMVHRRLSEHLDRYENSLGKGKFYLMDPKVKKIFAAHGFDVGDVGGGAATPGAGTIYARDPQGKLHQAKPGTQLPPGWSLGR